MKMENLNNKYIITLTIILLTTFVFQAQEQVKSNIALFIDDVLVTSGITIDFVSKNDVKLSSYQYHMGTEISVDKFLFDDDLFMKFGYIGEFNKEYKHYYYRIQIEEGMFYNTKFLIFRIYNLDKKKYKKIFCDSLEDYVVEVQNQVYYMGKIRCK